jgi:acetylornithine deacetylase/succinyl-diaminopimelate desuccinylase-like protein
MGEAGFTALERIWIRPTAEINGLTSGYQGIGSKTIIPREASAKISFRLVPGQQPDGIARLVRDFLVAHCPAHVAIEVSYDHGGEPYYADPDSAYGRATQSVLAAVFGRQPALIREGLSIPIVSLLQQKLGRSPLLIGLGLPDCQAHAPNETFPLEHVDLGIRLHQELLRAFAEVP